MRSSGSVSREPARRRARRGSPTSTGSKEAPRRLFISWTCPVMATRAGARLSESRARTRQSCFEETDEGLFHPRSRESSAPEGRGTAKSWHRRGAWAPRKWSAVKPKPLCPLCCSWTPGIRGCRTTSRPGRGWGRSRGNCAVVATKIDEARARRTDPRDERT